MARRLMIAINSVGQNNLYCAECGGITHAELGPNVNVLGDINAFVCDECVEKSAPALLQMVHTWRKAEYMRLERERRQPATPLSSQVAPPNNFYSPYDVEEEEFSEVYIQSILHREPPA